jgi:hypothetical protein
VKKLFLLVSLFVSSLLLANKVIYFSYDDTPSRVVKGEIFPVTLKTLSVIDDFEDVNYSFTNHYGLKVLTKTPLREKKGKYFYDTFYFLTTKKYAKLPDIEASLISFKEYNSTKIDGKKLNIIELNPPKNFSNIIAKDFELIDYKTTTYDKKHNIIIIMAEATMSDINAMHFNNVFKQGIESIIESQDKSKITYYLVVDKKIENFSFTYFNLNKNKFVTLNLPIVVDDDSVSTQTDLKPKDQSKERLKIAIAAAVAFFAFIVVLIRKKYIYIVFVLIPLAYIAYLSVPEKDICIKTDANIYLLPVENGTVFETTTSRLYLPKEGSVTNFVKVKLHNKIGWVKNEDTCSY